LAEYLLGLKLLLYTLIQNFCMSNILPFFKSRILRNWLPVLFLLNISSTLFAQRNQWAWMKGDKTGNNSTVPGTQGVSDNANKPGSRVQSYTWTDAAGNFWMLGGFGRNTQAIHDNLDEFWKYNPATNEWTWVRGSVIFYNNAPVYGTKGVPAATNWPGSRRAGVSWTDAAGDLWLFGGRGAGFPGYRNDVWKYNTSTSQWTWVSGDATPTNGNAYGVYGIKGVPSVDNKPGGRYGSVNWIDTDGNLWIFGGIGLTTNPGFGGYLNDLWKFNMATNEWTWVSGDSTADNIGIYGTKGVAAASNLPGSRQSGAGWTDGSGNLWLFGGYGYRCDNTIWYLNDLWKYNTATHEWTWVNGDSSHFYRGVYGVKGIPAATNKPGPRSAAHTWADPQGNFWLFGGAGHATFTQFAADLGDLWRYNPASNLWTWIKGDSNERKAGIYGTQGIADPQNKPGSRSGGAAFTDGTGNFWLFGGAGYGEAGQSDFTRYLNDLWKYTPPNEAGTTTPVLSNIITQINENTNLLFKQSDFQNAFSDPDGNAITKIKIVTLPLHGTLKLGSALVQPDQEINIQDTDSLLYIPDTNFVDIDSICWNGSDNNSYANQPAHILIDINSIPVVSVTSPANNSNFPVGSTITVQANATDADGTIAKVEFYYNGNLFGTDSNAPYSLTVGNVEVNVYKVTAKATDNTDAFVVSDTVTITVTGCNASGTIYAEGYLNIPGTQISDLTSDPAYPDNPSVTGPLNSFEYTDFGDNYGGRLRGYICAPMTGTYTFYIAGDDQAALFLSTDENPANKTLIAYNSTPVGFRAYTTFPTQLSKSIQLVKGVRYYIETLHKQSSGANHLSVSWVLPNGVWEAPIPGTSLSPWQSSSASGFAEAMTAIQEESENMHRLTVIATPNPSQSYFTLTTKSSNVNSLALTVRDTYGRVVESKSNLSANGTIRFGSTLHAGVYFVEVIQGSTKKIVKLVKR
jgi:N-acetylneuraminic acid mutarotase